MAQQTALVAGATGVVGRYLLAHLARSGAWNVIALSRRMPDVAGAYRHIPVDLLDRAGTQARLSELSEATHIFFAAYVERADPAALVADNLALLVHLLDAIEPIAPALQHVHLVHGSKWYGSHLGRYRTPAKETDPRHLPPNFYYDQQDHVAARQRGKAWSWTASRPHGICGFSLGSPMNLIMVIAVYATLCRELELPLDFPGTPGNYGAIYQCTDSWHLAKAIEWLATRPECANEPFNVTNGDFIRWENVWPQVADYFGLPCGRVRTLQLEQMMADKAPLWQRIVARHGLEPYPYDQLVRWRHGDFVFTPEFDVMSDTGKLRRAGFHELVDTEAMFLRLFDDYRRARIIP